MYMTSKEEKMRHRWGVYVSRLPSNAQLNTVNAVEELRPVRVSAIRLFVTINGLIGDVSANIKFYNHLPVTAPAVFLFPLTYSTSVKQCQASILHRRDLTKRSVALECHQVAEREKRSKVGFVIEQSASNVVELQLGLLSPGDEVEVTLQYAILFDVEGDGSIKFLFPTFLPRQLQSNYTELCAPEIYQTMDLQCRAVISGTYKVNKIVSEHRLEVDYKNEQREYVQVDTVGPYKLSEDFDFSVVYSDLDRPHVHIHSPIAKKGEMTHWLQSSYCAHLTLHHTSKKAASTFHRNEYILCIDRSGSMYGNKIELVRDAVTYFIRYLQPGSYFNIISYGSSIRPLFKTSQKLTAYSAMKALKLRKSIKADMFATNILGLLQHIYTQGNKTDSYKQVYLITDGGVENPDSCIDLVKCNSESTRMFTFGLDKTASRYLVSNLARAGHGKSYYLKNPQTLCNKVVEAMRLSAQSCLTNLNVTVQLPTGMELSTQPDVLPSVLFSDETLSVCIIICGQPADDQTKCSAVMTGRHEGQKFKHVTEFDLKDAVVTHGAPLHQLAIKSHIHDLHNDVEVCRNADEILEIHQEMVDLSMSSGIACKQTKFVSVDTESRYALNDLPVVICRPEKNLSPHSSTVKVKFKHGIDIFRSSQVMLKALMSRHASLSRRSVANQKSSMLQTQATNYQPLRVHPYSHRHEKYIEQKRTREVNGQKFSTTQVPTAHRLETAKVAAADTDSYLSSLINTDMDAMSFMKYDDDSLPPEMFNIIEEYSDRSFGSPGITPIRSRSSAQRPRDFSEQFDGGVVYPKFSDRQGEMTPLKIASTSDYYSVEVSPVSDVLSYLSRAKRHSVDDVTRRHKPADSRNASLSSSGVGSSSHFEESASISSIQNFSIMTSCMDPEPCEKSIWRQFREQEVGVDTVDHFRKETQRNEEGRLALHNPSLLDSLIAEDPLMEHILLTSTPKKVQSGKDRASRRPVTSDRTPVEVTKPCPVSPTSVQCTQTSLLLPQHKDAYFQPAHSQRKPDINSELPTTTDHSQMHAPFDTLVHNKAVTPANSSDPLKASPCYGAPAGVPTDEPTKEKSSDGGRVICWKGKEIKHLGDQRYGERFVVQPLNNDQTQSDKAGLQGARIRHHSELSDSENLVSSFPMMDDQTSTSDISTLVREYWVDHPKQPMSQTDALTAPHNADESQIPTNLSRTQKLRNGFRRSFRRLKKLVSA